MTLAGKLGTINSRPGNVELGAIGAASLHVRVDLGFTALTVLNLGTVNLSARILLGATSSSPLGQENELVAQIELGFASPAAALSQSNVLASRITFGLSNPANLIQDNLIAARIELGIHIDDSYTGPGSGLVVSGQTIEQQIDQLEVGDEFQVTLPWAGVRGRTGLARVLSRSRDSSERLTFVLLFIPTTDPSLLQSQVARPRLIVATRDNLARRLTDAERSVNKLNAD